MLFFSLSKRGQLRTTTPIMLAYIIALPCMHASRYPSLPHLERFLRYFCGLTSVSEGIPAPNRQVFIASPGSTAAAEALGVGVVSPFVVQNNPRLARIGRFWKKSFGLT